MGVRAARAVPRKVVRHVRLGLDHPAGRAGGGTGGATGAHHPLLPYLDDAQEEPAGYDLRISVAINGQVVSEPPFSTMYWTAAQQLAHMTVNGASLRTGDLYGSGTVSGPTEGERGSLLELTWNGRDPLELPDGKRAFLEDGDVVTLTAWAPGPDGTRVGLGEVTGRGYRASEGVLEPHGRP